LPVASFLVGANEIPGDLSHLLHAFVSCGLTAALYPVARSCSMGAVSSLLWAGALTFHLGVAKEFAFDVAPDYLDILANCAGITLALFYHASKGARSHG
jgi:hypothetical protein